MRGRQRVEIPHGWSGILDLAQGIQVSDIALGRGLFDIGTTTSRSFVGNPCHYVMAPAAYSKAAPGILPWLLITVSTRSTDRLSYILIQFDFIRCFTKAARHPRAWNLHFALVGHHLALEVAGKLRPRKLITSLALK